MFSIVENGIDDICQNHYIQFSIYKIDIQQAKTILKVQSDNNSEIIEQIIYRAKSLVVDKNEDNETRIIAARDFSGILIHSYNEPAWKDLFMALLHCDDIQIDDIVVNDDFLINVNVSYIILFNIENNIYAMTGGYGSNYIKDIILKNYGLSLIPKIVSIDDNIIKRILENNISGNLSSMQRSNKNATSISIEQDFSSVYKELFIEIDSIKSNEIGIEFDPDEVTRRVNIQNRDSITIKRALNIMQLKSVLSSLAILEQRQDNFPLNYLTTASKKGMKESDLYSVLINKMVNMDMGNFIIVGDDYENYYYNAEEYILVDDNNQEILSQNVPFSVEDLYKGLEIRNRKINKSAVTEIINKWKITITNNIGEMSLYPVKVKNMLQGFVEEPTSNRVFYLISGSWYTIDESYINLLDTEYVSLYNRKKIDESRIKENFDIVKDAENEDLYNNLFKRNDRVIFAHTCLMNNIELADLIFYDDDIVYLMHNKNQFSGASARDVANQIHTVSNYLQKRLAYNRSFLGEYYDKLCEHNEMDALPSVSRGDFISLFNKKITFICGFLTGYTENTESTYGKYLMVDLNKKMISKGYEFIPISIQ